MNRSKVLPLIENSSKINAVISSGGYPCHVPDLIFYDHPSEPG
jgi:hypothetical protein